MAASGLLPTTTRAGRKTLCASTDESRHIRMLRPPPDTDAHAPRQRPFMEHRFGRRFRCGTPVRLSADGISSKARLADVSLSGAYLQTELDVPLSAVIEITAERNGRRVSLRGSVVRRDARGMGVEWCETPGVTPCRLFGCTQTCELV
jgi:hypothetical protein